LYFLVGGLLVAVLSVGYYAMSNSRSDGAAAVSAPPPATSDAAAEPDSQFKIDVKKDGSVSGSIDQKSD
jgi:hypothetical protein